MEPILVSPGVSPAKQKGVQVMVKMSEVRFRPKAQTCGRKWVRWRLCCVCAPNGWYMEDGGASAFPSKLPM